MKGANLARRLQKLEAVRQPFDNFGNMSIEQLREFISVTLQVMGGKGKPAQRPRPLDLRLTDAVGRGDLGHNTKRDCLRGSNRNELAHTVHT
jgi:hypothetical protein